MNEKYAIRMYQDNEYAVYDKDKDLGFYEYEFKGSLEEVNAWISLREKGFNI